MYRVKKSDGWNKYKIQKRFLWLFWFDHGKSIYLARAEAEHWCNQLNCLDALERLL